MRLGDRQLLGLLRQWVIAGDRQDLYHTFADVEVGMPDAGVEVYRISDAELGVRASGIELLNGKPKKALGITKRPSMYA
jgi:hypothetical protein